MKLYRCSRFFHNLYGVDFFTTSYLQDVLSKTGGIFAPMILANTLMRVEYQIKRRKYSFATNTDKLKQKFIRG